MTQLSARFYVNNAMADIARTSPTRQLLQAFARNLTFVHPGQTVDGATKAGRRLKKSMQLESRPKNARNVTK